MDFSPSEDYSEENGVLAEEHQEDFELPEHFMMTEMKQTDLGD